MVVEYISTQSTPFDHRDIWRCEQQPIAGRREWVKADAAEPLPH